MSARSLLAAAALVPTMVAEGTPAWLANLDHEFRCAGTPPVERDVSTYEAGPKSLVVPPGTRATVSLHLSILAAYCPAINRWLDSTKVQGTPEARRVYGYFRAFCAWEHFEGEGAAAKGGLAPLIATAKRLRGLQ